LKIVIQPLGKIQVDLKAFEKELRAQMEKEIESMLASFELTTSTWSHKPKFRRYLRVTSNEIYMSITTDDDIYRYVSEGTRVRRAIMSKDWRSKTRVNVLTPGAGAGKMVFVSKKVNRPGIKARRYPQNIWKNRQKRFKADIQAAIGRASVKFIKTVAK
jgi:hypothetical protein